MSVLVLDSGNNVIKAKIARRERGEIYVSPCTQTIDGSGIHKHFVTIQQTGFDPRLCPGQWATLRSRRKR